MKKTIRLFLIVIATISLLVTGCGNLTNNDNDPSGDKDQPGDTDEPTTSAAYVTAGIEALKKKDFDTAYTKFGQAYAADKTNTDAVFWASLLNVAGISTDSNTVSLMKDRIGLIDYPSTMNELFSKTWFNSNWYWRKGGFVESTNGSYIRGNYTESDTDLFYGYDSDMNVEYIHGPFILSGEYIHGTFIPSEAGKYYTDCYYIDGTYYFAFKDNFPSDATRYDCGTILDLDNPILLPRLTEPSWAPTLTNTKSDTYHAFALYPYYLIANLIEHNPNGLNDMIDGVLAGVYGSRLDTALGIIDSLPDTATLTIPNALIAEYSKSVPETEIVLNKAELKAFAAAVEMDKSFIQLLASYNLDYPLAFLKHELWSSEGSDAALTDLLNQDNPFKTGFLTTRNESMRSTAKETMITGLDDLTDAITLLNSKLNDNAFISGMTGGAYTSEDIDSEFGDTLTAAKTLVETFETALKTETTLGINPDAMNSGSLSALLSTSTTASGWGFTPSVLYSTDIFNPAKLFKMNGTESDPSGIVIWGETKTGTKTGTITDSLSKPASGSYEAYGVYFNWNRLTQLVTVPSANTPPSVDDSGYYQMTFADDMDLDAGTSDSFWNWMAWIQGI